MYFNKKGDTNIDKDFSKNNLLSYVIRNKKIFLIVFGIILLLILMIVLFVNRKITNYLELLGNNEVTIYQGSDYIEPGYKAYNSKDEDLSNDVVIDSNLNNKVIGEYQITYILGEISYTRKVNVVEKPKDVIYIYLNSVNDNVNVYLKKGDKYTEPGYQAYSTTGVDLTKDVMVIGDVDSSKKGTYKLTYSVIDSNGVTVSASRTVVVMDSEVSLTLDNENYTNTVVTINASVIDEYFDYMVLPDGTKSTKNVYLYKVSENGEYIFKIYNKKGGVKESSIEVKNIDKVSPSASCTIDYNDGSTITVKATDASGIGRYVYDGKDYSSNKIDVSSYIDNAKVKVYDKAGNSKEISCKSVSLPVITSISNDGVIVTVNAKKLNKEIAGYYFSYDNKRPNKDGGYLAASNETIDVVRLPGTTYVWVEDVSGRISKPMTITLTNEVLPKTLSGYTVLKGTSLGSYLTKKGWSLEEFNKLIARSVRAAGLHTKVGAATAAVSLQMVLIQKYKIKIPYWMGGKTNTLGAYSGWGMYKENPTYQGYYYYGMDCGGFVNWSYHNTGIEYSSMNKDNYYFWDGIEYKESNGEVGDVLRTFPRDGKIEHVAIIVGKTEDSFIVAEAYGSAVGIVMNLYPYNNPRGYTIIKGENLTQKYNKIANSEYPSGF